MSSVDQRSPCALGKLSPSLTLCALSILVMILVVVNSCIMFSLSGNWFDFKHTYFLLLGLLLWAGWPGIAQLCQVFPSSVTRGAWACREVNENAEPEGRKDLPARCQGMSLGVFFTSDSGCIICPPTKLKGMGVYKLQDSICRVCAVPLIFCWHTNTTQWHLS